MPWKALQVYRGSNIYPLIDQGIISLSVTTPNKALVIPKPLGYLYTYINIFVIVSILLVRTTINNINSPLVFRDNIILLPLHMILGLMKQFVKVLENSSPCFENL